MRKPACAAGMVRWRWIDRTTALAGASVFRALQKDAASASVALTSMCTPSGPLHTHPVSASCCAVRCTKGRKPTPCTRPSMWMRYVSLLSMGRPFSCRFDASPVAASVHVVAVLPAFSLFSATFSSSQSHHSSIPSPFRLESVMTRMSALMSLASFVAASTEKGT